MMEYADLEIGLHRHDADSYIVEMRFSQPDSDAEIRLMRETKDPALVQFDVGRLRTLALDADAYGKSLGDSLFSHPAAQAAFSQVRASVQSLDKPLRLRLLIDPGTPELHALRWETLRDPHDGSLLFTGENILFSRYLSSLDWRPVRLRPQAELSALVMIANPANLDRYQLAPVDVAGELARAKAGLGSIGMSELASGGQASLNNLIARLREGYDILYLVCHGALLKGEAWLWLEDEQGNVARVSGSDLLARLNELQQRPRLVVLASCQSAGTGDSARSSDEGALAALGPRLAETGIPAVIAMQGNVTMQTVAEFMPVFFQELQRDGQIDRAIAVARGRVRGNQRPDWWIPTLFMRLKSGRIWYEKGFRDPKAFEKWPALLRNIRKGQCTPILGPGLLESLLGSTRDIARRWAEQYHYPLAPHEREDLPQVAQFLSVNQDKGFPRDELADYLIKEIQKRYRDELPERLRNGQAALDELIDAVGVKRRATQPLDAHKVLAGLPFPIYITTTPDNLLVAALKEAGKDPQVELCPWNEYVEQAGSLAEAQADYRPTPEKPLVYYLLGRLSEPDSLVLTEDDYFDYLIGVTSNKDLIPSAVRRKLADTALLFLGFQLDEWNFRIVYRSLLGQEGRGRRSRYAHVAAQIDPEGGRIVEPERARKYLESYFQDAAISIYWGSAEDFISELQKRASESPTPGPSPSPD